MNGSQDEIYIYIYIFYNRFYDEVVADITTQNSQNVDM